MAAALRSLARLPQQRLLTQFRAPCIKSASYISTSGKTKGSQPEIIGDPKQFEDYDKPEVCLDFSSRTKFPMNMSLQCFSGSSDKDWLFWDIVTNFSNKCRSYELYFHVG